MIPENINRDHIKKAILEIDESGIAKGRKSTTYDVLYNGKLYPPKLLISIANRFANGKELDYKLFQGGDKTKAFEILRRENFEIIKKQETFYIYLSKIHKDKSNEFLNAKMVLSNNEYKLLKGSYVCKSPKPSFKEHTYYQMRTDYENRGFFKPSNFDDFLILEKDIFFKSPSPSAVIVLNRAANGKTEWKLKDGTSLEHIDNDIDFNHLLNKFLIQAKTNNLKTKDYPKKYKGLKLRVSFGAGNPAKIPWIAFLDNRNKVTNGIYPVYLYFKSLNKIILAYGLSETNNPDLVWNIDNPLSIKKYFIDNNLGKPARYGSSYLFKIYETNEINNINITEDLDKIIKEYKNQSIKQMNEFDFNTSLKKEFEPTAFRNECLKSGLFYKAKLITRYIASLATKPFVLLSGLSGSGKTKLAQAYAQWIAEDESQYCIVPVGADWTNREPLLGYVNALNNEEYILPENGALKLLIEANKEENKNKPYFLILDEMNLSHVERYFADFLSIMESKDQLKLHSDEEDKGIVCSHLNWPKNLFIIGTVNIDETTYMFSPKVLDRANVIEFRVNTDDISKFLDTPTEIDFTNLNGKGARMGENFIQIASNKDFNTVDTKELNTKLILFFEELKKTGAEFGYRTATEIHRLYNQLTTLDTDMLENDKIDIAIMQKLLPKLHGSRRKLCPILETLASFCVVKDTDVLKAFLNNKENIDYKTNTSVLYPLSLEKITRMHKGAVDNGFASYAEA